MKVSREQLNSLERRGLIPAGSVARRSGRTPGGRKGTSGLPPLLRNILRTLGYPPLVEEFAFHPSRQWRFDAAIPSLMLAVEVDGGTRTGGRHVRGDGFERDCEKLNAAALLGWRVLRFTTSMVQDGRALVALEDALAVFSN